ncbi:MAG: adenosylmethionine decarboxylase [Polaromonas sp.]
MNNLISTLQRPAALDIAPSKAGQGTHLLCEWYGCDFSAPSLNQASTLRMLCMNAAIDSGLNIVGDVFHQFEPQGVTGTVLLAESHMAIHTWPEEGFVTVDVYVCNYMQDNTQKALNLYGALKAHFNPAQESFLQAPRGLRND